MRIRLDVAYDGGEFRGWAAQPGLRTVEGELSAAMATVLRVPTVELTCAGRTDAGVHARGQVVHVDLDDLPDGPVQGPGRLVRRLNGVLATDLRVRRAVEAPVGFDARFSAVWRRYAYRVVDDPAAVDPLARGTRADLAAPPGRRRPGRGLGRAAGDARLRVVLQAARGRDHDPHAAGPGLDPRRGRRARGHGARRRVLPQHGPRAGRLPAGGGRGQAAGVVARRGPLRAATRPRGHRRAGARADVGGGRATRRTTSWPRGPRPRGPSVPDHYFSADPSVPFQREPLDVSVWGHDLALVSGSGVFARGRLDVGTAVLFRETSPPSGGRILDLGCGYGVIGLAIAAAAPSAVVTAVDVNERAVLLANENAASLGVADRFTASTPEAVDPAATYDEIWSNPPDPGRQAGAPRPAAHLAAAAGPRRPGRHGRGQEPGRRLPPALARRPGLADRAAGEREGLPGAAGHSLMASTPSALAFASESSMCWRTSGA